MGSNTQTINSSQSAAALQVPATPFGEDPYNPIFDAPPSGAYIVPLGVAIGSSTLAVLGQAAAGCWLLVPKSVKISNMGFNITVAGTADSVVKMALYRKTPGINWFTKIFPIQTINTGINTGIQQVAINQVIPAGRYMSLLWCSVATTSPTVTTRTAPAGDFRHALDSAEATTDNARGGIGMQDIVDPTVGSALWGAPSNPPDPFYLIAATRSTAIATFLQVA